MSGTDGCCFAKPPRPLTEKRLTFSCHLGTSRRFYKLILADEPTGALDSHSSQMLLSTIQSINEDLGATILMVTHDAFSASYANRILFMRDGAIFTEIRKGGDSRRTFFEKILDVLTMMGGGTSDVR